MFRHERPQQGRYRQFHQIDCEAFGFPGPDIDAEMIQISARLWRKLGIRDVRLSVNSLGTPDSRKRYRGILVEYFAARRGELDADSLRRLETNPLRILDSKNPALQALIEGAPRLSDHLDAESRTHFDGFLGLLAASGIAAEVDPRLVRGLDYYTRTVFEWRTSALGSQDAVCSGGRYDGLVEQLGGEPTPAIGWALGIERIVGLHAGRRASRSPRRRPRSTWCCRASGRVPQGSRSPSGCATRCPEPVCSPTWMAAASRRSSSARTRAAPSSR